MWNNELGNINNSYIRNDKVHLPISYLFVEQKINIDCATFFSIKELFGLLHADIAYTTFLTKPAVDPKYCLLFGHFFPSKNYTYPLKNKNLF